MEGKIFTATDTPNVFMVYKNSKETKIVILSLEDGLSLQCLLLTNIETKALVKQLPSSNPIESSDSKITKLIINGCKFKIVKQFVGFLEVELSMNELTQLIEFLKE